jgi:hypothetical protein
LYKPPPAADHGRLQRGVRIQLRRGLQEYTLLDERVVIAANGERY